MCTLSIAWRVFDDAPVVVAANRDERLGRPATPPALSDPDSRDADSRAGPRILAPRDEKAGGTWIGVNERGLFVGVTNRYADVESGRSRGLLTRDALGADSAREAVRSVETMLASHRYAGFNLVLADAESAVVLEWDGVLHRTDLDRGVHVVVNEGVDDAAPKAAGIRAALRDPTPARSDLAAWRDRAAEVLADHDLDACIHGNGYGTRSSSIVTVTADGDVTYEFADGPPCETAYRRVEAEF